MESKGKKFDKRLVILAITIIVVLVLSIFTFVLPDREGQLRTDLVVGDYYVIESDRFVRAYIVEEVYDDGLLVTVKSQDKGSGAIDSDTYMMTKDDYLFNIYFDKSDYNKVGYKGAVYLDTPFGIKLCKIFVVNLNSYDVDEYGVVYSSAIGGVFWNLSSTTLLIGLKASSEPIFLLQGGSE